MSITSLSRRPSARQSADPSGGPISSATPVPWVMVVLLAAAMAYADGFWLTVLRDSVGGTVTRVLAPFNSWWQESTLYLPVFVFAVLAALLLAKRWFGDSDRQGRRLAGTGLLVASAGTVAGMLTTAGSSAYDYYLGVTQRPSTMGGPCDTACVTQRHHDLLVLHLRGVAYISRWIVLSDLAAVAVIVALTGGSLLVWTRRSTGSGTPDNAIGSSGSRARDLRLLLAATVVGGAAIHAALIPGHVTEWGAAGIFFLFLTIWQVGLAGLVVARVDDHPVMPAVVGISALPLVLWLVSRTAGLPFGPGAGSSESIGVPDALSCVLEIVAMLLAVVLLRASSMLRHRRATSPHVRALLLLAVLAVTAIAVAGVGLSWLDIYGVSDTGSIMSSH